ncbi:MAG TPA: hypothetical protein VM204_09145 [Gaiellaceae bacterium]|nr:hypothetical protein [Gaiellaceae bacterium]
MIALAGSFGDVDREGQIVDVLLLERARERWRAQIGEFVARDFDREAHVRLVEELLERARERRSPC